MKKRTGFVSNSSTSSFICDVCGTVEAGMDLCLSDFEMSRCENGHTFHDSCVELNIEEDYDTYELPEKYCPFCNLELLTDQDAFKYTEIKYDTNKDKIKQEMKEKYETLKAFKKSLKTIKNNENQTTQT